MWALSIAQYVIMAALYSFCALTVLQHVLPMVGAGAFDRFSKETLTTAVERMAFGIGTLCCFH